MNSHLSNLEFESLELIRGSFIENHSIATTSFGTTSAVLIHIISKIKLSIPVVFIDTGFHFDETMQYYHSMALRYSKLNFVRVCSDLEKNTFLKKYGYNIYDKNPEFCCNFNKVYPLKNYFKTEKIKIWYAAVRKSQNTFRNSLDEKTKVKEDMIKIHPLLSWTETDVSNYMKENSLPSHPLQNKGYDSIGCYPCTKIGEGRTGRWANSAKSECGLHLKNSNN